MTRRVPNAILHFNTLMWSSIPCLFVISSLKKKPRTKQFMRKGLTEKSTLRSFTAPDLTFTFKSPICSCGTTKFSYSNVYVVAAGRIRTPTYWRWFSHVRSTTDLEIGFTQAPVTEWDWAGKCILQEMTVVLSTLYVFALNDANFSFPSKTSYSLFTRHPTAGLAWYSKTL